MASHGVQKNHWNLCKAHPPAIFVGRFDFVFFSEMIEHLPIPRYIALEQLRKVLKPAGIIICTTPNLHRLRNVLFMALGREVFDQFQYADEDVSLGYVIEYSRDHLDWQMKNAGFAKSRVEYSQMNHLPTNPLLRPLAWLGYPLHVVPAWRDNLEAIGYAPSEGK